MVGLGGKRLDTHGMRGVGLVAFSLVLGLAVVPSATALNRPTLVTADHVQRHPRLIWTLPANVEAWSVEIASRPDVASEGFFEENRFVFDSVSPHSATQWVGSEQLAPGTYYALVKGYDNACLTPPYVGECGVVISNVLPLTIPPLPPRYIASVKTIHPGAILDTRRNWTYTGDTVRASFRNAAAPPAARQPYTVCYTANRRLACQLRTLNGSRVDSWRVRILPPWAGMWRGRYVRWIEFSWRVSGRVVAKQKIWVYE
jgi:hypothetical protein